jgi:hypothetical protein
MAVYTVIGYTFVGEVADLLIGKEVEGNGRVKVCNL